MKLTNPAASRLPRPRGTFNPSAASPDAIRPNAANGSTLLRPGNTVIVTAPGASDLRMPSVTSDNENGD